MKTKLFLIIAVLVIGAVPAISQEVVDLTDQSGAVKEVTITNEGYNYMPSEIRVNVGDTVRLTYENGGGFHDWVLDEFDASTRRISGGSTATIEFTADEAGTFEFYCSVGNHRALGMVGDFVVVE
ncbi:MAG: multicopper oxidase domain-containing protein [Spirochaetes bacterium]|jgi:plastocyanin|nr:multicopper oxidase domain-containing protein [Spirochaetota bacterium]